MKANTGQVNTVLFDLDGTLLDTAPDLCDSLNLLLQQENQPCLSLAQVRPVVSCGGRALIRVGFDLTDDHANMESLLKRFLQIYSDNLANKTKLFPGMARLLDHLEQSGMLWGVVTNKQSWLTEPLLAELNLAGRASCIVSGNTTPFRKPHPEPLFHACKQINKSIDQCMYVGDHQRDIDAGNQAGMLTIVALFGYIGADENPEHWQADAMIEHPMEILNWIS